MIDIIQKKLQTYKPENDVEKENALKEILQKIALYALWRANFFNIALFQGGASLRILHGLPRFSEDLNFILRTPDPDFDWSGYLYALSETFKEFGLKSETLPRKKIKNKTPRAIIKDGSIANQLNLTFSNEKKQKTKLNIKLKIDVNPPPHSGEAQSFLDFPLDHQVRHQDLASNFALKIHAILCRDHFKSRDWYDFSWYVSKCIFPNLLHLQAALMQSGSWANEVNFKIDLDWLTQEIKTKIQAIDWSQKVAVNDVKKFLSPSEAKSIALWDEPFFISKLQRITIIAAEQGNANAQYNLGLMYHEGKAVPQNDKSAVMWFTRAAEQGNSNAQFNLGLMYAFGYGVPKNYIYAHMWLNIAAIDEDVLGANLLRDDLEKNMTPSEISAARERASECVRKNYKER